MAHTMMYWHLIAAAESEKRAEENSRYPECRATWLLGAAYHYEQAGKTAKATEIKNKVAARIAPRKTNRNALPLGATWTEADYGREDERI